MLSHRKAHTSNFLITTTKKLFSRPRQLFVAVGNYSAATKIYDLDQGNRSKVFRQLFSRLCTLIQTTGDSVRRITFPSRQLKLLKVACVPSNLKNDNLQIFEKQPRDGLTYILLDVQVKIILKDAPGLDLQSSSPSAAFCVTQRESVVLEYILKPRIIGEVNITISASIDSMYIGTCGPETLVYTR